MRHKVLGLTLTMLQIMDTKLYCNNKTITSFCIYLILMITLFGCKETDNKKKLACDYGSIVCYSDVQRVPVHFEDTMQVVRFLKLKDGKIIAPIVIRSLPRLDGFSVSEEMHAEDVVWVVSDKQKFMYLPVQANIEAYIFMVKGIGEGEESWRFFQLDPDTILASSDPILPFPGILSMEKLSSKNNKNNFLQLYLEAEKVYRTLENRNN